MDDMDLPFCAALLAMDGQMLRDMISEGPCRSTNAAGGQPPTSLRRSSIPSELRASSPRAFAQV